MKSLATVVLVACAFAAIGCDDKKGDAKPASSSATTATGAAKQAPAPAKSAAPGGGW